MEANNAYLLKNKPLPDGAVELVSKTVAPDEKILFAIMGDLNLAGKYAQSVLFVTRDRALVYDGGGGDIKSYPLSQMSEVCA